jgi:dynein heavy chain
MLIASSPFAKFFIQDVLYWKQTLVKVQEILEEWSKTQRGWCYLWPIFMSQDIQNQLPDVYTQFLNVDTKWRQTMNQTQATPNVLECANQFKAYENFVHCNDTLEKVTKSLNEYLHSKQLKFPRFFFLSNDDLLHILS